MNKTAQLIIFLLILLLYIIFITSSDLQIYFFSLLFPDQEQLLYPTESLLSLTGEHLLIVGSSSILAVVTGVTFGIAVTREFFYDFRDIVGSAASAGQTFPPAAVLALSFPIMGFGVKPTILALFLFSILPILQNTISGVESVSPDIIDSAKGMGMKGYQILFKVELPIAFPVIAAGIRTAVIINIGTAAIGATIGAGGLGAPIISGLVNENPSFILEGALGASFMALIFDSAVSFFDKR